MATSEAENGTGMPWGIFVHGTYEGYKPPAPYDMTDRGGKKGMSRPKVGVRVGPGADDVVSITAVDERSVGMYLAAVEKGDTVTLPVAVTAYGSRAKLWLGDRPEREGDGGWQ